MSGPACRLPLISDSHGSFLVMSFQYLGNVSISNSWYMQLFVFHLISLAMGNYCIQILEMQRRGFCWFYFRTCQGWNVQDAPVNEVRWSPRKSLSALEGLLFYSTCDIVCLIHWSNGKTAGEAGRRVAADRPTLATGNRSMLFQHGVRFVRETASGRPLLETFSLLHMISVPKRQCMVGEQGVRRRSVFSWSFWQLLLGRD